MNNKSKFINKQLGHYIAGLIEGDGNIWTQKDIYQNHRINNPQITFTFHKREKPLFDHLKLIFKTGSIYTEKNIKNSNVSKYRISETNKLIELINLINGKLRTPKINYLYRAIDHINYIHNTNIIKLPLNKENIENNAWLSGFTDADGNFFISLEGKYKSENLLKKGRVKCIYSIGQRKIDRPTQESCIPFMTDIANTFNTNINIKTKCKNTIQFLVQANNKHNLVKSYFDKYPLMTIKHYNYLSYLEGINYLGKQLTEKEIIEIQNIKNSMNNKRIFYNWDHLNNFYK